MTICIFILQNNGVLAAPFFDLEAILTDVFAMFMAEK